MATIRFPEGTTFRYQVTIKDETGAPINLTGAALTFAAYTAGTSTQGSPTPFLVKTLNNGIVVVDAPGGICRIDFDPTETVDKAGTYDWELELIESSGDVWLVGGSATNKLIVQPGRHLDT
jgi:hypothetical protein